MENDKKLTVRAVERALDILLCFTERTELTLTEISSEISLHKSTVHRLLTTLEMKGFVIRNNETEKYRLGFRVWELSANLSDSDDPAVLFLPEMERLRDLLEETVSLYIRDRNERIRVQAVQSNQTIRRVAPVGARMPLSVGASSKVLVAYADDATQHMILNDSSWPETISKDKFMEQCEHIKQKGYATSVEEREQGVSALSVPIMNRSGQLIAALAVSGPVTRLTVESMEKHAELLMETATRLGKMVK
ncbi:MAG: IclR family transcriptional regulator [Bacilli bacterium]